MYAQRLRTHADREHVARLYARHMGRAPGTGGPLWWCAAPGWFQVRARPVLMPVLADAATGPA
jgi:hypothetical protein